MHVALGLDQAVAFCHPQRARQVGHAPPGERRQCPQLLGPLVADHAQQCAVVLGQHRRHRREPDRRLAPASGRTVPILGTANANGAAFHLGQSGRMKEGWKFIRLVYRQGRFERSSFVWLSTALASTPERWHAASSVQRGTRQRSRHVAKGVSARHGLLSARRVQRERTRNKTPESTLQCTAIASWQVVVIPAAALTADVVFNIPPPYFVHVLMRKTEGTFAARIQGRVPIRHAPVVGLFVSGFGVVQRKAGLESS